MPDGLSCDMDSINAIAKKRSIDAVEDAAPRRQRLGSQDRLERTRPSSASTHARSSRPARRHDNGRRRARGSGAQTAGHGMASRTGPPQGRPRDHRGVATRLQLPDDRHPASIGLVQLAGSPAPAHPHREADGTTRSSDVKGLEVGACRRTRRTYQTAAPHEETAGSIRPGEPAPSRHRYAARRHDVAPEKTAPIASGVLAPGHRGATGTRCSSAVRDDDRRGTDVRHRRASRGARYCLRSAARRPPS